MPRQAISSNLNDKIDSQKIKALQMKSDRLKEMISNNIESIISQGESLESLQEKAELLSQQASVFTKVAKKVEEVKEEEEVRVRSYLWGVIGLLIGGAYGYFAGYAIPVVVLFATIGGAMVFGVTAILGDIELSLNHFNLFKTIVGKDIAFEPKRDNITKNRNYLPLLNKPLYPEKDTTLEHVKPRFRVRG